MNDYFMSPCLTEKKMMKQIIWIFEHFIYTRYINITLRIIKTNKSKQHKFEFISKGSYYWDAF